MENLPAAKPVWQLSSPERAAHREWIGGRCLTLLGHYWRDNDPVELSAAIGRDWADVLEGLPQNVIQIAAIKWLREFPETKPKPGHIWALAMDAMPKPKMVPRQPPPEPRNLPRISGEASNEICRMAGFRPKSFGDQP